MRVYCIDDWMATSNHVPDQLDVGGCPILTIQYCVFDPVFDVGGWLGRFNVTIVILLIISFHNRRDGTVSLNRCAQSYP